MKFCCSFLCGGIISLSLLSSGQGLKQQTLFDVGVTRQAHTNDNEAVANTAQAARLANPTLLEPLMSVEVRTPEEYMGDVIGDLNSRRGQIQSMDDASGVKVVTALVPLSEMFGYVGDLRSKTSGRAVYSMTFETYAEVPKAVSDEIVQKAKGE